MWDYKQTCKFLPSLALAALVVNMNIIIFFFWKNESSCSQLDPRGLVFLIGKKCKITSLPINFF